MCPYQMRLGCLGCKVKDEADEGQGRQNRIGSGMQVFQVGAHERYPQLGTCILVLHEVKQFIVQHRVGVLPKPGNRVPAGAAIDQLTVVLIKPIEGLVLQVPEWGGHLRGEDD